MISIHSNNIFVNLEHINAIDLSEFSWVFINLHWNVHLNWYFKLWGCFRKEDGIWKKEQKMKIICENSHLQTALYLFPGEEIKTHSDQQRSFCIHRCGKCIKQCHHNRCMRCQVSTPHYAFTIGQEWQWMFHQIFALIWSRFYTYYLISTEMKIIERLIRVSNIWLLHITA